jgi:exoribonuclease II
VYMPGWKITMLPDSVVQGYTLTEGRNCPAVSLYVEFDEATLEQRARRTVVERVPIVSNLRHDKLDAVVTETALNGQAAAEFAHAAELAFAWRLARHLKAGREAVRGKPETFNRPDYNFKLQRNNAAPDTAPNQEPDGSETVLISTRQRGAPLDLIVAEAMILANSSWGTLLAERGVPAIYRSQASLAPGIKVRMGVRPLPHAGMGVANYSWATSPLRRYVDLVNQWQIIACARHGATAALVAPFKPKDAALFAVISGFDAAYSAYNDFQHTIERYWTLRWLQQNGVEQLQARVMKDGLVRAETLPLVFRVPGTEAMARGSLVNAAVAGVDLLTLELHARLVGAVAETGLEASNEAAAESDDADDELAGAAPLALAIDVNDGNGADAAAAAPASSAEAA